MTDQEELDAVKSNLEQLSWCNPFSDDNAVRRAALRGTVGNTKHHSDNFFGNDGYHLGIEFLQQQPILLS